MKFCQFYSSGQQTNEHIELRLKFKMKTNQDDLFVSKSSDIPSVLRITTKVGCRSNTSTCLSGSVPDSGRR